MKRIFSLLVILMFALVACGVAPDPVTDVDDTPPVAEDVLQPEDESLEDESPSEDVEGEVGKHEPGESGENETGEPNEDESGEGVGDGATEGDTGEGESSETEGGEDELDDEEFEETEEDDGESPLVCEGINYSELFKEMRRIVTVNTPKLIELFYSGNFEELEKFVLAKEGDMAKFREIVQLIRTCSTL